MDEGNLLFISGSKKDDVILLYKAFFNGAIQIREMILSYHDGLHSSSLGSHTYLESYVESLTKFLDGWTSSPFIAREISSEIEEKISQSEHEMDAMPPLPNEIVHEIFRKLDSKDLKAASVVCKIWGLFAENAKKEIAKDKWRAEQEEIIFNKEKINIVFEHIKNRLKPDSEGNGDIGKRLSYKGFTISEPTWYGVNSIMFKLNGPDYRNVSARISCNRASIDLFNYKETNFNNKYLPNLVELCEKGKNPWEFIEEEENDSYQP